MMKLVSVPDSGRVRRRAEWVNAIGSSGQCPSVSSANSWVSINPWPHSNISTSKCASNTCKFAPYESGRTVPCIYITFSPLSQLDYRNTKFKILLLLSNTWMWGVYSKTYIHLYSVPVAHSFKRLLVWLSREFRSCVRVEVDVWAVHPNKLYGLCGRKAILNHASALVTTACP